MYHIVSFDDTEEVEVVPVIWVKNSVCLWPPYKDEGVQKAVKCLEQPQESWSAYNVKIMYTANNYSEACRKLAEQQTDLQSEVESDSPRPTKRQIKRNRLLLDDYDSDEEANTPLKKPLPPQQASSSRASQDVTEHISDFTWPQDTTVPSPDHETPRPQRKSLSSSDPFITSLLFEILSKQELLMEQQKNIIRMVQDLKANNDRERTEADRLSPNEFTVEDLMSLTSMESGTGPEITLKVETNSESGEDEMAHQDEESCSVQIGKQRTPKMGKPCAPTCGKKCTKKIPYARRKEIFNAYQEMSNSDKWAFVFHTVTQSLTSRLTTGRPSRRNKTFKYRLNNSLGQPQDVCKTFYLTTLGYHPKNDSVIVSVTGNTSGADPPQDRRGRHPPGNKIDLSPIHEHIESFNPTVSDFKCEHAPNQRYLPSHVTVAMMYKDFKGKNDNACSYETYRRAIKDMNIGFRKQHAEECLECDVHMKTEQCN
ncbi:uncharacterized protein [Garra rufa]|uniref:uncharacterized protein n=1 Tax=Garra rufa TaxID=137080 RepID=UPI003CCED0C9